MSDGHEWKLLSVDELEKTEPDFFVYPRLPLEQRCTVQAGETLKVAASMKRNGNWKTKGIWLQVKTFRTARTTSAGDHTRRIS